ncbi:hypothetical protein SPFM10_00227 [Salmonella phage SPFM10]|nr:hypothetical protein SPFM10_00227 [Salmonella phage SPFM10]
MTQFNTTIIAIRGCPDWWWDKPVLPPSVIDEITLHLYPKAAKVLIEWLFPDWDKAYYLTESAIHDWRNLDLWPRFYHWENGVFSLRNREVHVETGQTGIIRMELFENGQIIEPPYVWNAEVVPYIEHCRTIDPDVAFGEENMTDPEVCSIDDLEQFERTHSPLKAKLLHVFGTTWWINESRQFLRLPYLLSPTPFVSNEEGVQRHQQQKNLDGYPYIINQTPLPDEWWPEIDPYETSFVIRFSYQRPEEVVITTRIETVYDVISPTWDNDENHVFTTGNVAGGQNVLAVRYAPTRVPKYDDFKDYLKAHFTPDYYLIPKPALKLLNECYIAAGNRLDSLIDMGRYSTMTESEANVTITLRRVGPSRDELLRWAIPFFHNPEDQVRAAPVRVMYVEEERDERARINRQVGLAAESTLGDETPVDYSAPNRVYVEGIERASVVFTDSFNTAHQPGDKTMRKAVVDGVVERVLNESQ